MKIDYDYCSFLWWQVVIDFFRRKTKHKIIEKMECKKKNVIKFQCKILTAVKKDSQRCWVATSACVTCTARHLCSLALTESAVLTPVDSTPDSKPHLSECMLAG